MNTKQTAIDAGDIPALTAFLRSAFLANRDNIPNALKEKKAWLIWKVTKIEPDRGKFDKIPHYPRTKQTRRGVQGCERDFNQLGSWEEALEAITNDPSFAGVGVAMLPEFGFTALDADNKIAEKDGQIDIDDEVKSIISGTYSEISPSGKGLRSFWLGSARDGKNHPRGFEVFHSKGFVTVTGECVNLAEVAELSVALSSRLDELLPKSSPAKKELQPRAGVPAVFAPSILKEVSTALEFIPADDRDLWVRMGHALCTLGDVAKPLWHEWSAKSDKYGPEDAEKTWASFKPSRTGYEAIFAEARKWGWEGTIISPAVPKPGPIPKDPEYLSHEIPGPFPGVMTDIVDAALKSAHKPQPALTVLAALIGMAAACDGAYSLGSGGALNLYGLGVGSTGTGKDHAKHVAECIGKEVGAILLAEAGSGQGLEDALEQGRALLCVLDEVAHTIAAFSNPSAPPHLKVVGQNYLKLFSAGKSRYIGRALAGKKPIVVEKPCVNLLGFATPEKLGDALKYGSIADGLVGRMLMASADGTVNSMRQAGAFSLPESVTSFALHRTGVHINKPSSGVDRFVVSETPEATAFLNRVNEEFEEEGRATVSEVEKAVLVRSMEKVERIAGVLAVWCAPSQPEIKLPHVEWALSFVRASNTAIRKFVGDHIHSGKVQADAAAIRTIVKKILIGSYKTDRVAEREAINAGYAPWSLALKRSGLDSKEFELGVQHAVACGELAGGAYSQGGRRIKVISFPLEEG